MAQAARAIVAIPGGWPPNPARLAADPLRPQFHLLPARGWMNDPNAPVYWRGKYHMFFQYNPGAAVWGDMHWDHAISDDMLHWRHAGVALAPTPGSWDADGAFTGSFIDLNGTAAIIYTGVQTVPADGPATLRDGTHVFREVQALATTQDPLLRSWQKVDPPVLAAPPIRMDITGFRDPSVWRDGDTFYMTVGSGIRRKGGMVLLYRSPATGPKALRDWEYMHPLASGEWNGKVTPDVVDSGEMWECPEFFPVGDRHCLIYSTERKVYWWTGHLDRAAMTFAPTQRGLLDAGAFYAPKTQLDADGNRILWGWINETRSDEVLKLAGWAGCISLPRALGVNQDGALTIVPAAQVQRLRGKLLLHEVNSPVLFDRLVQLPDRCVEIEARLSCSVTLWLQTQEEGIGSIRYNHGTAQDPATRTLTVGKSEIKVMNRGAETHLHMFLDGSVLEVFINGEQCLTTRLYDSTAPGLGPAGGPSQVISELSVWAMKPISADRLAT